MNKQKQSLHRAFLSIVLIGLVFFVHERVFAADYALVVGVGSYATNEVVGLEGVENDVVAVLQAMRKVFDVPESHITVLHDRFASRDKILGSLDELTRQLKRGDRFFFYFSGHGTSAKDASQPDLARLIPYQSGAIVPYDVDGSGDSKKLFASLIVGQRDLRPRLAALDEKGVKSYVFFDSCYSGNAVRSIGTRKSNWTTRKLPLNLGFDQNDFSDCFDCGSVKSDKPYPYKNVYFLSAAQETEEALDIDSATLDEYPTRNGKFHGAFTDALLRVWYGDINADSDKDGVLSMAEMSRGVSCFMERRGYQHEPQLLPSQLEISAAEPAQQGILSVTRQPGNQAVENLLLHLKGAPSSWAKSLSDVPGVELNSKGADLSFDLTGELASLFSAAGDRVGAIPITSADDLKKRAQMARWVKHLKNSHCTGMGPQATLQIGLRGQGSNFTFGQSVPMKFRANQAAHWMLLDINPAGEVHVLYPAREAEFGQTPANQTLIFPADGTWIRAGKPAGVDSVVALAFASKPPFYREFAQSLSGQKYGSKILDQLIKHVEDHSADVGVSVVDLRVRAPSS